MTKHPRKSSLAKLAAGALVAVGLVAAAGSSAMADSWKRHGNGYGDGNKHWRQSHYRYDNGPGGYYYYQPRPQVVYVQPQPVYVAPPPPVYYVQPAPVYRRPEINIVFPLDFD